MWCLNTLQAENERCPNCRSPYNRDNYRISEESERYFLIHVLNCSEEDSNCEDEFGNIISREKRTVSLIMTELVDYFADAANSYYPA